jgi:UDP:flavonoid glycosyltransferase YjiC (YdhE family)
MRRIRILFVAEGVTLAHVTRPLILARSLDTNLFEIHFACTSGWERILTNLPARFWPIKSISSHDFLAALSKGRPIYTSATLHSYVKEDLHLLKNVDPDLVVGDFRLSLSVSAGHHGVPYATITNAYWSEYCDSKHYPIPELPVTRIFGVSASDAIFQRIQPWVFAYHARPLNHVRRKYGMPPFLNLLQTYTDANHVLYADIPGLFAATGLPNHHCYLGPLSWAPNIDLPDWWAQLDADKPLVYVTLGSSGPVSVLPTVLEALAPLSVSVVIATAGRWKPSIRPSNIWAMDFLPGDRVAKQASLIICNGGSPSVYQALQEGTPVIGIPSNMDQHLMMQAVVREGAGSLVRSEHATRDSLQEATLELLGTDSYRDKARQFQKEIAQHCATTKFAALVTQWARDAASESFGAPH